MPEVSLLLDFTVTRDNNFSFLVLVSLTWDFLTFATNIEQANTGT